ncbi:hypothetical protein WJX74_008768 [Apatococcus lobatus]|uniref:Uncharacterized protein n=1 Tax=Apatococcus lobatus TaxID=904363 RepID=A0AAW1RSZ3_9CHLO
MGTTHQGNSRLTLTKVTPHAPDRYAKKLSLGRALQVTRATAALTALRQQEDHRPWNLQHKGFQAFTASCLQPQYGTAMAGQKGTSMAAPAFADSPERLDMPAGQMGLASRHATEPTLQQLKEYELNTEPVQAVTGYQQGQLSESAIRLAAEYERGKQEACMSAEKKLSDLRQVLQAEFDAELKAQDAQNRAAQGERKTMLEERNRNAKLYAFSVQGRDEPGLSGVVPRQILDAEPDSALAQMYNGTWEYSMDDNRAIINSDPAHWPSILRWLSFGTVPKSPTPELILECKYWQLERLLAAIDAGTSTARPQLSNGERASIVDVRRADSTSVAWNCAYGFTAETTIHTFLERLETATDASSQLLIPFKAAGSDWTVRLHQKALDIQMANGPPLIVSMLKLIWGTGDGVWVKGTTGESAHKLVKSSGLGWGLQEKEVHNLMHPRVMSINGSMHLAVTMLFKL